MNTTTAHDMAMRDKIYGIAHGDYKEGIRVLEKVFEQRKRCAELILANNSFSGARDFIEVCDSEIKKVLYL